MKAKIGNYPGRLRAAYEVGYEQGKKDDTTN